MIDITDGVDNKNALTKFAKVLEESSEEENPWTPTYSYSMDPENGTSVKVGACTAQCNVAEVNGKLVVFTASATAGFALIEFPKAQ